MGEVKRSRGERIAIFGGSFDPVHNGHLEAAILAIEELELDRLIFVPTATNPAKLDGQPALGRHRLRMLELAARSHPRLEVSNLELRRGGVSYTTDTLQEFRRRFKTAKLYLLIGSDNLDTLPTWRDLDRILSEVRLVVFQREGEANLGLVERYGCILLRQAIGSYSSTKVKRGELWHCPDLVRDYIASNHLYLEQVAANTLSSYRYQHCLRTASIASQLASRINLSTRLAYTAGLTHDLTKEWDERRHREFLLAHGQDPSLLLPYQYHQASAATWLREVYRLRCPSLLKAVATHTSLSRQVSRLAKVLFVADKISKYNEERLASYLELDLEQLFELVVRENREELRLKGITLTRDQEVIYERLLGGR